MAANVQGLPQYGLTTNGQPQIGVPSSFKPIYGRPDRSASEKFQRPVLWQAYVIRIGTRNNNPTISFEEIVNDSKEQVLF